MAFECDWLYALDYHNEKSLPKTEHLMNLVKENGFNQVVMNVFSYDVNWKWGKDSLLNVITSYSIHYTKLYETLSCMILEVNY